ncbi:MAG: protein disulfide oxidoreductase [Epsilonproteobacteria bacterium]|nr:protein disulfide oxidoreductase [Campylobacterota bacterium]
MKKWSIKNILKEIVSTLLIVFVLSLVINYIRKPDISSELPKLNMALIDGNEVSLEGKGKPTVLHFWATWCPTCKFEAPNLQGIQDEAHVITVAVNSGTDEVLKTFMQERGYTYAVVNDTQGNLAEKFNVGAFPTTFMYDSNGKLQFSEVGYSTTLGLKARLALIE